jgi:geranylgeranyl diphosphate synthase, type II
MKVNDPHPVPPVDFAEWLRQKQAEVEQALDGALPLADTRPAVVHEAMRYACLNGGKRIRGILCLAWCGSLGGDARRALRPAAALEAFHASTLVHDDLPCMDDDDLRRGQPATHIRFGEANALLAGNALLTLALQWMAETPLPPLHPPGILATELAQAGGSQGVIGGQIEDLLAERAPPDEERLRYIHTEKTARLIACACRTGALCAGACAAAVDRAGRFGLHLGLAFQIQDDILDSTRSSEELGKPAKSDEARGKLTALRVWGLEKSREMAAEESRLALAQLEALETEAPRLREIADLLLHRGH